MPCSVDLWTIPLDDNKLNILSAEEELRAARFHFDKDRLHWTAARSALRVVLSRYVDARPLELAFTLGDHGKPALAGSALEFNLSHSHGWAMIAVSRSAPVGVDLEAIRERVDMKKLLQRLHEADLPADRDALFQRWTDREARTKAVGSPLMEAPPDHVHAAPVNAPAGFAASIATVGGMPETRYCGSL